MKQDISNSRELTIAKDDGIQQSCAIDLHNSLMPSIAVLLFSRRWGQDIEVTI